jgi:sugar O-acyltransferase (sialic acid O-acetyltransferase NeuD family)
MASSDPIVVYGAGGHGKVVADAAELQGYEVRAFLDDGPGRDGVAFFGRPVATWERFLAAAKSGTGGWQECGVAMAIGANVVRERLQRKVAEAGVRVVTVVHPRAVVARTARLGAGTVVIAGATVNPDAIVGLGAIVNTGAVVEHDCVVGDFAHFSPNATLGGDVHVGVRTHMGLGAVALPGVRIGADVRVGAGAVVHRNVADGLTVVGVPARPLVAR